MKNEILKLRSQGKTYNEIKEILGCSKGLISYHCGQGQKEKTLERQRKNRNKEHPFKRKIESFFTDNDPKEPETPTRSIKRIISQKIKGFCMSKNKTYNKPDFTVEDVINKFGKNPKCYLTGDPIDISKTRSYHFDHIVPKSRGGQNTLDNLGLTTSIANTAKNNMTHDEFVNFCKKVLENHGYSVNKSGDEI